ncbi:hypothetical protein K438DRAFT_2093823 [Mycena galopus ATCC 62051]|nr:hypothetical protein K438DRAFT_2093823 [Mycena galopus ATCC 62051]
MHDRDNEHTLIESNARVLGVERKGIKILGRFICLRTPEVLAYHYYCFEVIGSGSTLSADRHALDSFRDLDKRIKALVHHRSRKPETRVVPSHRNHYSLRNFCEFLNESQIFSALLLFVTQKLATRRSIQKDQMLTTTHENAAAWAGIGAAISLLWNRRAARSGGSVIGLLSAIVYLAAVSGLHITSSSLFSLVTFNSTRSFGTGTHGLPAYNSTARGDASTPYDDMILVHPVRGWVTVLYFIRPHWQYWRDKPSPLPGNATVGATGFNVTCGYLELKHPLKVGAVGVYSWMADFHIGNFTYNISSTQPGMISTAIGTFQDIEENSYNLPPLLFYSTIPIIDSSGEQGSVLSPPKVHATMFPPSQVFRCSLSLVSQVAVVDSQTRQILTLEPELQKNVSAWLPFIEPSYLSGDYEINIPVVSGDSNLFIDTWESWYYNIPPSAFPLDYDYQDVFASAADVYLIQKLNLPAANQNDTLNATLHDVENALSTLIASMFWTLGHIPPTYRRDIGTMLEPGANGTLITSLNDVGTHPLLLTSTATVTEIFSETALEIYAGLAVSVVLMLVSSSLLWRQDGLEFDEDLPVNGTGILHAIWLYRNHPDLEARLEQVEYPTDQNLRAAGMVRTRLAGGRSARHRY